MNLYHLRYFITLAKMQHFINAAQELLITQPSLSHAITQLEKELGVTLFEKKGRNGVLSKFGQRFYDEVKKPLDTLGNGVET